MRNMNAEEVERIVTEILERSLKDSQRKELSLDFPVEVSARHVHLTQEAVEQLFGCGARLTPKRNLSQPGQYLAEERVSLVTDSGRIEKVAVLGPPRPATQVELSATDCRNLHIHAPVRLSGDLEGAGSVYIMGPKGMIFAPQSVIIAQAHIHITPQEAKAAGIEDKQVVAVTIQGKRKLTFENIICRVSSQASLAMHIDSDEANACLLQPGSFARMQVLGRNSIKKDKRTQERPYIIFSDKLITDAVAREIVGRGAGCLKVDGHVIITPSAKDTLKQAGMEIEICGGR